MQEVTKTGTAASARPRLGRNDIAGKTGTTNDSNDVWFAGYNPRVAAVAWIGFDKPKSLGDRETGAALHYQYGLTLCRLPFEGFQNFPRTPPPGVVELDGDWAIPDFAPSGGIRQLN